MRGLLAAWLVALPAWGAAPEEVRIPAEGITLTGYLYRPDPKVFAGPRPAIVLLHGRSGLYGAKASRFDADHLSARTRQWGEFWAARGYVGLYVDSFGPRGYPTGFAAGTNDGRRPPEVNEIRVRPRDAYAGLRFLRARKDVEGGRVFLQGWSNGGSAALAAMHVRTDATDAPSADQGFRAAIAMYPGCGPVARHHAGAYAGYAPVLLMIGTEDDEVSFRACEKLAQHAENLTFRRYAGATHAFDAPDPRRRAIAANRDAALDAKMKADEFLARWALKATVSK